MKKVALATAALVLAGCSSVVSPASPTPPTEPDVAAPSVPAEPTAEPTNTPARNPYEGGAERDWGVDLPGEPSVVSPGRARLGCRSAG